MGWGGGAYREEAWHGRRAVAKWWPGEAWVWVYVGAPVAHGSRQRLTVEV